MRDADETSLLRDQIHGLLASHGTALSPLTQATYRNTVRRFCDWHVAQFGTEAMTAALTTDEVGRYLQWCAMRLRPATIRLRHSALRWVAAALTDTMAQEQLHVES